MLSAATSSVRPRVPRSSASASNSASVRRASSCSARPSIGWNPGAIPASAGNEASRVCAKAWIVWMRRPPGVSSTRANSRRARCKSGVSFDSPSANNSLRSSGPGSRTHWANRSPIRLAISDAPDLVKVRHRIAPGLTPCSNSRSTRAVSTCVLPVPADADSAACADGSAARAWSPLRIGKALKRRTMTSGVAPKAPSRHPR